MNLTNPKKHPTWPIAQRCGLKGNFSDYKNYVVYDGSRIVPNTMTRLVEKRYADAAVAIEKLSDEREDEGKPDISVREAMDDVGWKLTSPLYAFVEWFKFDFGHSEPPINTSLGAFEYISSPNVSAFFVTDQRGYEYLVHCLATEFNFSTDPNSPDSRLFLKTTVTRISWSDQCVCVDTNNAGRTFCGKRAIVTFGIGVLQSSDSISFNPPLPQWKVDTINALHMPLYLKIFVKFNSSFWDDKEYVGRLAKVKGVYQLFQPIGRVNGKFPEFPPNSNTLLFTLTDPLARKVSGQQSIEETKNQIVEVLREMYPSAGVPEPEDILVPTWAQDPLYRGSYSNTPPGVSQKVYDKLAAPVGQLYFSGEATNADYHGTVHGAYLAGVASAKMVALAMVGQATIADT